MPVIYSIFYMGTCFRIIRFTYCNLYVMSSFISYFYRSFLFIAIMYQYTFFRDIIVLIILNLQIIDLYKGRKNNLIVNDNNGIIFQFQGIIDIQFLYRHPFPIAEEAVLGGYLKCRAVGKFHGTQTTCYAMYGFLYLPVFFSTFLFIVCKRELGIRNQLKQAVLRSSLME